VAIESFVAQNIDELARFSLSEFRKKFRELLEEYNRRVDSVEFDKSLMIDIPATLG
jgi:hypothetical protein